MQTSGAAHLAIVVGFAIYAGAHSYVISLFVRGLYLHRNNFFVSLRMPELLHLEVSVNLYLGLVAALRQVASCAGIHLPCEIMHLGTALGGTFWIYPIIFRACKVRTWSHDVKAAQSRIYAVSCMYPCAGHRGLQHTTASQVHALLQQEGSVHAAGYHRLWSYGALDLVYVQPLVYTPHLVSLTLC
jgi:hypothetical protein